MRISRARVDAALVLALAVVLFWATRWFGSAPDLLTQGVSPAFFPRLLLGTLMVLALLLAFERTAPSSVGSSEGETLPRRTVMAFGLLIGGVLLIPAVGVLPAMGVAAAFLAFLWGERRSWFLVGFATVLPALLYVVFSLGLGVHFAVGHWLGGS